MKDANRTGHSTGHSSLGHIVISSYQTLSASPTPASSQPDSDRSPTRSIAYTLPSARRIYHDTNRTQNTYATVRLLADELVLERGVRRQRHRDRPCRVARRAQRDLGAPAYQHPRSRDRRKTRTALSGLHAPSCARLPTRKTFCAARCQYSLAVCAQRQGAHLAERRRRRLRKAHRHRGRGLARRARVQRDRAPRGHARRERPARHREPTTRPVSATGPKAGQTGRRLGKGGATHALPVHAPPALAPPTTSQYVPSGRDVANVPLHTPSALLIATNPSAPAAHSRQPSLSSSAH